jgi:hypothetical protein
VKKVNNERRKKIAEVQAKLEAISIINLVPELQVLLEEEQSYVDNMPVSLSGSERASMAEEAVNALDEAVSNLEDAANTLQASIDALTDAGA